MVSYPSINLVDLIIDEVALEGLDGITLEALWIRIANRLHYSLPLPKPFMLQIWSICVQVKEFGFFELEEARQPLVIFDRYEFVDPDLGIILEPKNVPEDVYPHCPIYDVPNAIKGSCSTYHTRKAITEAARKLSLDDAREKYGQKLVIVASQSARNRALMGDEVSPTLELNAVQYCFLERVGRSRYQGEITQGKLSLNALKEDPRSLFYHRKLLLRHKLITKQIHHQKCCDHSCNGSLLHLPRFYVERKPKAIFLAEEVVKILKTKPNCVAEYDEIKRKLQIENAIKKLFKTSFFQKIVKTDIRVPYRTLYPKAKPTEWQQKNDPTKEKKIKVVQLLLPAIDIVEAWNKDEIPEEDEPQELNISNQKFGVPYLKQANAIIESTGSEGVCQTDLARRLGLTKLQSRTVLRNVVKSGIVATYMNDMGRQRLAKYVSKKFEHGSALSTQFKKEMHKIKELTRRIPIENNAEKNVATVDEKKEHEVIDDREKEVERMVESTAINENSKKDNKKMEKALQNTFYVVNRILYKYHLTKYPNRYRCTFSNLRLSEDKIGRNDGDRNSAQVLSEPSESERTSAAKDGDSTAAYKNIKVSLSVVRPISKEKSEGEVFGLMENVQNSERKTMTNLTYRLLRRANMIMESVRENQVIDDTTKLMKMIHEEEDKEGYDVKIDKKSLHRLLQKLAKDRLIKNIKLTLSGNGREKNSMFVCDPTVSVDSPLVHSAVEQAKLKFYLLSSQRSRSSARRFVARSDSDRTNNDDDTSNKSEDNFSPLSKELINFKCGSKESKKYGYCPKFLRMKALHLFLFYLVYEHPGDQKLSKDEQVRILRDNDFKITDKLAKEFTTIYAKDIGWKMFVPPLPTYVGWSQGWALMCDVLLRLPLSVFLKIHYLSYAIPELEEYTNHPIRKHYLVRDLPNNIRNSLMYARKYIFNIHETVTKLCYIGLVQFGPQRLKEKDQVFIYVNRNAEILDTTSSGPSYHKTEDKPYPVLKFKFSGIHVAEKYWYDLWNICITTPLGGRLVVQGKDIVLEDLVKKSAMIESVAARTPEEAIKLDVGYTPGDRKGAAGIDSACFAHLKRNWNWGLNSSTNNQTKNQQNVQYERDVYLSKIKAKPIKFTDFSGFKRVSGPPSVTATDLKKKVKTDEGVNQQNKYEVLACYQSTKQKSYVRRVLPRKSAKPRKRTKYDEIDYRALQRMHKLRVDWDLYEDKILLVCKVAMMYLCPNPRRQVITFSAVRDVLRTYSLSSYNKTSKACQRRLLYILRQKHNVNAVALGVEEAKQNFYIGKRFDGIVERLKEEYKNFNEFEKQVVEVFKSLVAYIAKKYYDISDVGAKEPLPVPITVQEFNVFYKVVHPDKPFGNRGFTKDARTVNDIHFAVINSVIHSSMCCGKDRRSWVYQLFKVYQQYPETLLRNAMTKIRSDQMVTVKKNQVPALRKYGNYMPMSSCQYQLSSNYTYRFHTKWPYDIFKESYDAFLKLSNWYSRKGNDRIKTGSNFEGVEVSPVTGGLIGAIHDYIMKNQIDFDVEIPDQIIMLDPRLKEKDETYFRIAKRYQDVFSILDDLKSAKEPVIPSSDLMSDYAEDKSKSVSSEVENLSDDRRMLDDEALDKRKSTSREDEEVGGEAPKQSNEIGKFVKVEDSIRAKCNQNNSSLISSSVSSSQCLELNSDGQKKFISPGKKRSRGVLEESLDADEPARKKAKSNEILVKKSEEAVSNSEEVSSENVGITKSLKKDHHEQVFTRVSDILKNIPPEQSYLNQYCKIDDSADVNKRYTRIALLRMREELSELTVADSHHAHEYFVVNMFKVLYDLQTSTSQQSEKNEIFRGLSIPSELLPMQLNVANDLIQEINKFAVFPKNSISYSDFKKNLPRDLPFSMNDMDAVYNFLNDKKEIGASIQDLMDEFESGLGKEDLPSILSLLTEYRLLLRCGVTIIRYIHHGYADSWLINSLKINRLERESLAPVPKGSLYNVTEPEVIITEDVDANVMEESNEASGTKLESKSPNVKSENMNDADTKTRKNVQFDKDAPNQSGGEDSNAAQTKKRMQRKRTRLLPQKDMSRATKQLDLTTKQEVKVVIKPWIRIDGVLNRRVLDRMLGGVLSYCLTHPGIALTKVQSRFVPPLQPCQTRELVEMLVKLKCLKKTELKKSPVTLFSKPLNIEPAITDTDFCVEENIFLEPVVGAILKFGIFLSTKMYSTDYIT